MLQLQKSQKRLQSVSRTIIIKTTNNNQISCKGEEPRDGDKFSLCHFYNWFTDLSNLIRTTGDVAEMGGEMEPSLKGVSKHVSGLRFES